MVLIKRVLSGYYLNIRNIKTIRMLGACCTSAAAAAVYLYEGWRETHKYEYNGYFNILLK